MKRTIYVAGVNRKHLAAAAAVCPYWLLSVTLLIKQGLSLPEWLLPYLKDRHLLYDPGTFSDGAVSYQTYRRFLEKWLRKNDTYLQYDEVGDPEATAWYLQDMRRRGFKPIPVLQPGGDLELLKEPHLALGGLVRMDDVARSVYLDRLLHGERKPEGKVHLLGIGKHEVYERYGAATHGDCTSWIPRSEWNRRKSIAEWMRGFGEVDIAYRPPEGTQMELWPV